MKNDINRRGFLKKSMAVSASVAASLGLEKKTLAKEGEQAEGAKPAQGGTTLPMARIGNVEMSRLIAGGNQINGYAYGRNLLFVPGLMKHYLTDAKILEIFETAEKNGVNTIIMNNSPRDAEARGIRLLNQYWKERGGKIQWLAQCNPKPEDLTTNLKIAIDQGATGAFLQGGLADKWIKEGKVDLVGKVVEFIKMNGLIAGTGGHMLEVPMTCEKNGVDVDFYFKTLNKADFHCDEPQKVIEFMKGVKKPWIAYKVLGAGIVRPSEGFKYAFEGGADVVVAGMFDYEMEEDATIVRNLLAGKLKRERPWLA
ncbi:MAG: hypothetical protein A2283_04270 [Lentisphaerae bacterium RIFOXYA12_FULL_48_11]|nr:MAG: hypothetical protein A2283_04270 [Lentisphaerae bacterium RIFOXYA12_FULL_48_11]